MRGLLSSESSTGVDPTMYVAGEEAAWSAVAVAAGVDWGLH